MSTQWAAVPCYSSFPSAVKVDSSIRSDQRRRSAPDKVGERKQRERERETEGRNLFFRRRGNFVIFDIWFPLAARFSESCDLVAEFRNVFRSVFWVYSAAGSTPSTSPLWTNPSRLGPSVPCVLVCWPAKKKPIQRQFCCCLLPCYSLSRPVPSWTELRGKKPKCVYVREMVARFCASVGVLFNDGRIVVRISAAASQNGTSPKAAAERTKRRKKIDVNTREGHIGGRIWFENLGL